MNTILCARGAHVCERVQISKHKLTNTYLYEIPSVGDSKVTLKFNLKFYTISVQIVKCLTPIINNFRKY